MILFINNTSAVIQASSLTITELAGIKHIKPQGTAIALNGKLIPRDKWDVTELADNDRLTIISAAYGG